MDQIFNEVSSSCCYDNIQKAQEGMLQLITLSRNLSTYGFNQTIRTTEDFHARLISDKYTIAQWSTDKSVDPDLRRHILIHATKSPYIKDILDDEGDPLVEFVFNGNKALGLGLAYLWETPALSLGGDKRFSNIQTNISKLHLDKEGNLQETTEEVKTLNHIGQVNLNKDWILDRLKRSIKNGDNLWEEHRALFPHLKFCPRTSQQIQALTGSEQYFPEIVRHLFAIESAIRDWREGAFVISGVSFSPESESTLKNKKLRHQREFKCPDGTKLLFSMHTKIKSANMRIHYYPLVEKNIVIIGYIGNKLPTTKYKT